MLCRELVVLLLVAVGASSAEVRNSRLLQNPSTDSENEQIPINQRIEYTDEVLNTQIPSHEKDLPPPQYDWGGLYPRNSPFREVKSLDGVWDFRLSPKNDPDQGFFESWFSEPLSQSGSVLAMPVPSSYNDVTQDPAIRDHVGWAWYDTTFYAPSRWFSDQQRVVVRFGSVHYNAIIYINGAAVTSHIGGHLPIMADVTDVLTYGGKNLLTVAVNNTLTPDTIPQGDAVFKDDESRYPPGYYVQEYDFDFFNYAGIHRPVFLYTTPTTFVEDVKVVTNVLWDGEGNPTGVITYDISYGVPEGTDPLDVECYVSLLDANETEVAQLVPGCQTDITLEGPSLKLWWPYLMDPNPGYLYTMEVRLNLRGVEVDMYPLKVGVREVGWTNTSITINGRDVYIRGVGKHEDSDIRGKGYDAAVVVKDFVLLKWLGANTFRTSHYPYAEEIMDRADAEGIMVIDESPGVNLRGFGAELQARHIAVMEEILARDRSRTSVIMWSVANEPKSYEAAAGDYFKAVVAATKTMDPTRPVTCVMINSVESDLAAESLDVIWVNRYNSWYTDSGHLEIIQRMTITDYEAWHERYQRPVGISEYGADAVPGLHMDPAFMFSEEYQSQLLLEHFAAFDVLREKGYFFGEMIWNFADFMTQQGDKRVGGNKKGVFTRSRQAKASAFLLRNRYHSLAANETSTQNSLCDASAGQQWPNYLSQSYRFNREL